LETAHADAILITIIEHH